MEEKVFFEDSKGVRLCGILSAVPSGAEAPMVILCHGLKGSKESRMTTRLGTLLGEQGIASFRFDLFGHGESGGRLEEGSIGEFADDILSAVSFLKERGYRSFGVVGVSVAGMAAVIAASMSSDLRFVALRSPGVGRMARETRSYRKDFETKPWLSAAERVRIPALIVHGTADHDVEIGQATELSRRISGSRMETVSGADHNYTRDEDFTSMIKLISGFVISNAAKTRQKPRGTR